MAPSCPPATISPPTRSWGREGPTAGPHVPQACLRVESLEVSGHPPTPPGLGLPAPPGCWLFICFTALLSAADHSAGLSPRPSAWAGRGETAWAGRLPATSRPPPPNHTVCLRVGFVVLFFFPLPVVTVKSTTCLKGNGNYLAFILRGESEPQSDFQLFWRKAGPTCGPLVNKERCWLSLESQCLFVSSRLPPPARPSWWGRGTRLWGRGVVVKCSDGKEGRLRDGEPRRGGGQGRPLGGGDIRVQMK